MFENEIIEFDRSIGALREFAKELGEHIDTERKKSFKEIIPIILTGVQRSEPGCGITEIIPGDLVDNLKKKQNILESLYGSDFDVTISDIKNKRNDGGIASFNLSLSDPPKELLSSIENHQKLHEQYNLLYRSSFLTLLSSSEWFLSRILHLQFSTYPDAGGLDKKTLTFSDIKSFGSIEDAQKFLIEDKIEGVLRSGFNDWLSVLEKELHLSMGYLKERKATLIEIYQRRNLIVHNGGVINNIYLSKVDKSLTNNSAIGTALKVDSHYLGKAIKEIHISFVLIACELWKKQEPENQNRGDILLDIIYENLLINNWSASEAFCHFLMADARMTASNKQIAQLNYWLCKKRKGEWNSVKSDVEKADFSDKNGVLQIALHALREEPSEFFKLLPKLMASEDLNANQIFEFPIFEEMRKTEAFVEFLPSHESLLSHPDSVKYMREIVGSSENTSVAE